ncbi:hypothetical protein ABPG72_009698 [Tetrahymena utriculariae]
MKQTGTTILVLLAFNLAASQITIPIHKRIPQDDNESNSFLDDQDQIAVDKLINHSLEMYSGDVQLGNSNKKFTVDFDSGSNLLWLTMFQMQLKLRGTDSKIVMIALLKMVVLCMTNIPAQVNYGGGASVKGHIARVPITIAGKGPVTESLLLVEKSVNNKGLQSDGLMGLGVYDENDPEKVSFVNKLFKQGFIPKIQFSFYFGFGQSDSELVIGGVNSNKLANHSQIYYHPIILNGQHNDSQRWRFGFKSVSFGNQSVSLSSQNTGIVDSGTTLAYIRNDVYKNWISYLKTVATLKAIPSGLDTFYSVKCGTTLPDLTFTLTDVNGVDRNYALPSSFYILNQDDTCIIGIQGNQVDSDIQFLLGDVFMRRFVSVFDYTNLQMGLSVSIADPSTAPNQTLNKRKHHHAALALGLVAIAGLIFITLRALRK